MTREDIIRMAREAGMNVVDDQYSLLPFLERFAALVAVAAVAAVEREREACAKVAEDTDRMVLALLNVTSQPKHIAAVIRARSNT